MYPIHEIAYAEQRLRNTIIRLGDRAFYVLGVSEGDDELSIKGQEITNGKVHNEPLSKFNLVPVPLGFVNSRRGENASYLSRTPIRKDWRQGFRRENAKPLFNDIEWDTKAIAKTIENAFPTLADAQREAQELGTLRAFNRDFAVKGDGNLFYKYYGKVGQVLDDGQAVLDAKFFWCEEALKEAMK